jgi:hypothetical protein
MKYARRESVSERLANQYLIFSLEISPREFFAFEKRETV